MPHALHAVWLIAALMLSAVTMPAGASPPPPGSEDDRLLAPYGGAIGSAMTPGGGKACCDVADGTAVDVRTTANGWQVHFRNRRFSDAPKGWVNVPSESILTKWANPTGTAIVWWWHGVIRCFAPPAGV